METAGIRLFLVTASVAGMLALSACGGDGGPQTMDLSVDANRDGISDELEVAVQKALKIADAGTPGVLDPEEEPAFFAAISEIGERLPFSAETERQIQRSDELAQQMQTVQSEEAFMDLSTEMAQIDEKLMQDANYRLFAQTLNGMPALAPTEETSDLRKDAAKTSGFEKLERGDVMLINSGFPFKLFPYVWHFTHAGTYDGNSMVYESVSSGVRAQTIEHWKGKKRYAFGRNKEQSQADVQASLDRAKLRYGTNGETSYNWIFPNKTRDSALYCSQLVWKIQKGAGSGSDVDSNSLKWFTLIALKLSPIYAWNPPLALAKHGIVIASVLRPSVSPDEIYYSKAIRFYHDNK